MINSTLRILMTLYCNSQSQWSRGLRRRSAADLLLTLWVRIPQGAWMSVCCECCVLSGRGLCDALITRPEEPYRLWCVVVCDLENSWMRGPWPTGGCWAKNKQTALQSTSLVFWGFLLPTRFENWFVSVFRTMSKMFKARLFCYTW